MLVVGLFIRSLAASTPGTSLARARPVVFIHVLSHTWNVSTSSYRANEMSYTAKATTGEARALAAHLGSHWDPRRGQVWWS